jgi:hypothetical protein
MNIKLKLALLNRLTDELDSHIWEVFHKYIKLMKINFNGPDNWIVQCDSIYFDGTDGCRGCYDPMSLSIGIEWFIDYDKEEQLYKEKLSRETRKQLIAARDRAEAKRKADEERDKVEYERLKNKFG